MILPPRSAALGRSLDVLRPLGGGHVLYPRRGGLDVLQRVHNGTHLRAFQ